MLRYARAAVPTADFRRADIRHFRLPPVFRAALCTFDSLSHILPLEELTRVFRNVQGALQSRGEFAFDLCLEEVYQTEWQRSCAIVEAEEACFIRGQYQARERLGRTFITLFRLEEQWQRTDVVLQQRCYTLGEVRTALARAGFGRTLCY
jgi:hypothetical protein